MKKEKEKTIKLSLKENVLLLIINFRDHDRYYTK